MDKITDEKLLALSCAGDQEAFSQLVHRYEKELYNFLLKFLGKPAWAEDIFQEAFLQVHISAEHFDQTRRFRPWLYTIAANKARDLLRSRARRPAVQLTGTDEQGPSELWHNLMRDDTTPADILEEKQKKEVVRQVVEELPDHLREILILAYFQQLSYKEMAEVFDIPLGTVKSRLHAAVGAFAKKYRQVSGMEAGKNG